MWSQQFLEQPAPEYQVDPAGADGTPCRLADPWLVVLLVSFASGAALRLKFGEILGLSRSAWTTLLCTFHAINLHQESLGAQFLQAGNDVGCSRFALVWG